VFTAATGGACTATSSAAPANRASALAAWNAVQQDQQAPAGWTGSVDGCVVGAESSQSLGATLHTVNTLRDFAGLPPVSFDDGLNHKALAAALMMKAKGELSHMPDPSWPCYSSDGSDGAGHSNLYLGYSGATAMVGYVDDDGVPSVGHRRWVLAPSLTTMGSGSTGGSNALYVVSSFPQAAIPANFKTAWPPAGFVPWPWVFKQWSVTIGGSGQNASFQNPQITVTVDGKPLSVGNVDNLGATLIWTVDMDASLAQADHSLNVTISGATIDGSPFPVSYTVKAFKPVELVRFTGRPKVRRSDGRSAPIRAGTKLKVVATVTGGSVTGYQWLRGGQAIKGARKATYLVRKADRGKQVACRVGAASPNSGQKITRTSRSVRVKK
jgi:uncharacterized protein YkwD